MKITFFPVIIFLSIIGFAAPGNEPLTAYYPLTRGNQWRINTCLEKDRVLFYTDYEVESIENGQAQLLSKSIFVDTPGVTGTSKYQIVINENSIIEIDKRGNKTIVLKAPVVIGTQWISGKSIWGKAITMTIMEINATVSIKDKAYSDVVITQGMSWEDDIISNGKKLPPHFEVQYHFFAKNIGYLGAKTTSAPSKKAIAAHTTLHWLMSRDQ